MALNLSEKWSIPTCIIAFLANSLDQDIQSKVAPWKYFRKQILEIYTERMRLNTDIKGCINSNYLSLEEFLILFFLEKYSLRRVAEEKLFAFICSLKYY